MANVHSRLYAKSLGVVSLLSDVKEGEKKLGEEILRCFKSYHQ